MPSTTDWIMAASAAAGTLFAGALLLETRRQARINERQVEIAGKQAKIQQAQHDLQVQQDQARKPVLEVYNVTAIRVENDALMFNAQIANRGGAQVAPNAVLVKWTLPDGRDDGRFGRVLHRIPRDSGNLLLPGDVATFSCTIRAEGLARDNVMRLQVLAVDGTTSAEISFRAP